MIGSLGTIPFTASTQQVRTFTGLTKSTEARYAEHALVGRKPTLEFIGPGLDGITFSMRLDRFLGIDPEAELARIEELCNTGEAMPLVIGGRYVAMFVITSAEEAHRHHDGKGKLIVADVNLSLREYTDD